MHWAIERLAAHHQRGAFDCGNVDLNQFLQQQAGQLARKNFSKTYVAVGVDGATVFGFVSVSVGQVQPMQVSTGPAGPKLPRYAVPVFRVGRLAVDQTQQGQGLGQRLMAFALGMALDFSKAVGLYAVVVDAKDAQAGAFYQSLGFTPMLNDPLCLYLPVATLQQLP